MPGEVVPLPTTRRVEAAMEWALAELEERDETVSVETLRGIAELELKRPRDAIHADWARTLLAETERYR
jgi:hypothetical protein